MPWGRENPSTSCKVKVSQPGEQSIEEADGGKTITYVILGNYHVLPELTKKPALETGLALPLHNQAYLYQVSPRLRVRGGVAPKFCNRKEMRLAKQASSKTTVPLRTEENYCQQGLLLFIPPTSGKEKVGGATMEKAQWGTSADSLSFPSQFL